jgi:hypothetical protein
MASIKDKLSQLGRPVKKISLTSRDGSQELDVYYQCLTTLKERILREAMREEFEKSIAEFKQVKEGQVLSVYETWKKEFEGIGAEKCAKFIVASDRMAIRAETIRLMTREPLAEGATKEDEEAWIAEFTPIFEQQVEESVAAVKESASLEELAEKAVNINVETEANKYAYDIYRMRLIQESILEPELDANDKELSPPKYKLVFSNPKEVEELLSTETIDSLSAKITEEVRQAKTLPLK